MEEESPRRTMPSDEHHSPPPSDPASPPTSAHRSPAPLWPSSSRRKRSRDARAKITEEESPASSPPFPPPAPPSPPWSGQKHSRADEHQAPSTPISSPLSPPTGVQEPATSLSLPTSGLKRSRGSRALKSRHALLIEAGAPSSMQHAGRRRPTAEAPLTSSSLALIHGQGLVMSWLMGPLVAFDLHHDVFKLIKYPLVSESSSLPYLSALDGSVRVSVALRGNFMVWALNDITSSSWIQLINLTSPPARFDDSPDIKLMESCLSEQGKVQMFLDIVTPKVETVSREYFASTAKDNSGSEYTMRA